MNDYSKQKKISPFTSVGRTGIHRYGGLLYEEFLPELRGTRGVEVYKEMSDNDDIIGAILFAIEMLMRQCDFDVEAAGKSEIDQRAAEFVKECMNDMQQSWTDTISEIVSFLTYGWSYHEIVYKRRMGKTKNPVTNSKYNDGLIGWRKLPIRSQDTLYEWMFDEETDELLGMVQSPPPYYGLIEIPIEKAIHFVTKSRKNNPEGRSILRNCYRLWYFKKRIQEIEGIGIERDLAGLPILYGPEGMDLWDADDPDMVAALAAAETIVQNVRQDSRAGLVMPDGWKFELLSAGNRKTFDTNQVIDRHDRRIAGTVLADFIMLGQGDNGSWALSSDKTRLFSLAIGTYLDIICEAFNTQAIPRLIDLNKDAFKGITDYPKMIHGDIEDRNLEELSTFLEKMIGIGLLVPDEALEDLVRREGNLPERVDTGEEPIKMTPEEMKDYRMEQAMSINGSGKQNPEDMEEQDQKDQKAAEKAKQSLGRDKKKKEEKK